MALRSYSGIYFLILVILLNLSICYGQDCARIMGNTESITQPETNVTITKILDGSNIRYDIRTPIVDDFEFILAIDSSGSFGFGGDESKEREEAILKGVPRFFNYVRSKNLNEKYNFRVVVFGWNHGVDFETPMVPIENAARDIENLLDNSYKPTEDKHTDFSAAIGTALDIYNSMPPREYNRTYRFIILLTGASEFTRCDTDLIEQMNNSGIKIYSVAIDVPDVEESMMNEHLIELSGPHRVKRVTHPSKETVEGGLKWSLDKALSDELNKTLDDAIDESPGYNVKFIESLHSYLIPQSVTVNGVITPFEKVRNSDETYTINFDIEKGLPANTLTEIAINCDLDIQNLPVSVTKNRRPVTLCSPASSTPSSEITYNWLQIKSPIRQELPESKIDINYHQSEEPQISTPSDPPTKSTIFQRILKWIGLK